MTHPRRAQRRDIAEPDIVDKLRAEGWLVMQLSEFDLLICKPNQPKTLRMLECKTGKGKLTVSQAKMLEAGWPLHIVRTPEEAIHAATL